MEIMIPSSITRLVDAKRKAIDETKLAPFWKSDLVVEAAVSGETFSSDLVNQLQRFPEIQFIAPGAVGVTIPAADADQWRE